VKSCNLNCGTTFSAKPVILSTHALLANNPNAHRFWLVSIHCTCWVVSKTPIGIQKFPLRSPCLLFVYNPRNSTAFGRDTYSTCAFETWCHHVCTTCVTLILPQSSSRTWPGCRHFKVTWSGYQNQNGDHHKVGAGLGPGLNVEWDDGTLVVHSKRTMPCFNKGCCEHILG
jgi:hypothetical protein